MVAKTELEEGSTNDNIFKILGLHASPDFEFTSLEKKASALTESLLKGSRIKPTAKIVKNLVNVGDVKAGNVLHM